MSCCVNRGYNDSGCLNSQLQATQPIRIIISNPGGLLYSGTLKLLDLTQGAGSLGWMGTTTDSSLILSGGGSLVYRGCPSCPSLEVSLGLVLGTQESLYRGNLELLQGVASGYIQRTQGSSGPFSYRLEGRILVLQTLRLEARRF
jgi:hypothetical protein